MRRACAALLLAAVAAGCGGGGGDDFSVVRADGTEVPLTEGFQVFCGPWDDEVAAPTLHVETPPRSSLDERKPPAARFFVAAVLRDLKRARIVRFPHYFLGSKPTQAVVFAYDGKTKNETASDQEEASGRLVVHSYSCEKQEADVEFEDVVLGSEYFEGESLRVRGRLRVGG